jgi:hypothetical protein
MAVICMLRLHRRLAGDCARRHALSWLKEKQKEPDARSSRVLGHGHGNLMHTTARAANCATWHRHEQQGFNQRPRIATTDTRRVKPEPKVRGEIYGSPQFVEWRKSVLKRANGHCQTQRVQIRFERRGCLTITSTNYAMAVQYTISRMAGHSAARVTRARRCTSAPAWGCCDQGWLVSAIRLRKARGS